MEPGTVDSATGDWNDVTASVFYAATQTEMAMLGVGPTIVETDESGMVRAVYLLHTIKDAIARFEVQRTTRASPVSMDLTCQIGRFSDPDLEQEFIRWFKIRLKQLEGKDFAPVR